MRQSEFRELAAHVFGQELARTYARELSLSACAFLPADRAIEEGYPVREVWHALCDEMDVPMHQRWEVPPDAR